MEKDLLIERFHQMLASFNATRFSNEVGEFYQGETAVLACIASMEDHKYIPTPSAISDRLQIARGTVTATLRSLEKKGLAGRETIPDDRRRVREWTTEEGRAQVVHKMEGVQSWCSNMIDIMGVAEFSSLVDLLNKAMTAWAVMGR